MVIDGPLAHTRTRKIEHDNRRHWPNDSKRTRLSALTEHTGDTHKPLTHHKARRGEKRRWAFVGAAAETRAPGSNQTNNRRGGRARPTNLRVFASSRLRVFASISVLLLFFPAPSLMTHLLQQQQQQQWRSLEEHHDDDDNDDNNEDTNSNNDNDDEAFSLGPGSNVYKISRALRKAEADIFNRLRSIEHDAAFVSEQLEPMFASFAFVANLRCGLWYRRSFAHSCCFKSTDGHQNHYRFSIRRLNLNVAHLAAEHGGCVIIDSTRKGKAFPDSFNRTIPIWACVINRAVAQIRSSDIRCRGSQSSGSPEEEFDTSLHLPIGIHAGERAEVSPFDSIRSSQKTLRS